MKIKYFIKKMSVKAVIITIISTFTLIGCSELLMESPDSYYYTGKVFENKNNAQMALDGVYASLAGESHYGQYQMAVPTSDDMYCINGTNQDGSRRDISHYQLTTANSWVKELWRNKYLGLERANSVLTGLKGMSDYSESDADMMRMEAEALFLRALISFDLISMWGDVPYKTGQTQNVEEGYLPRTSKNEIYNQIVADLNRAKTHLSWATAGTNSERATQGAARALLMRVLLHRAGYSLDSSSGQYVIPSNDERNQYFREIIAEYEAFVANGFHGFSEDGYEQLWKNYCENIVDPKESIFEIAFYTPDGSKNTSGTWGTYIGPIVSANYKSGRANGFFRVLPEWLAYYDDNDVRRDVNMCNFQIDANGNQVIQNNRTFYPGKWRRYWVQDAPKDPNNTDVNFVFLRYADVVLMAAEAYNETGNTAEARRLINIVRERAGATLWDDATGLYEDIYKAPKVRDLTYISDGDLQGKIRTALYWERGFELCYEGTRKFDLIRWGVLNEAIQLHRNTRYGVGYAAPLNFVKLKHELLPIPLDEMQVNQKLGGKNNPGY